MRKEKTPQAGKPYGVEMRKIQTKCLYLNPARLAVARSRMITNLLDSIGVALKHRQVDTEGALEWAKEEAVLDLLEFGPRKAGAQP